MDDLYSLEKESRPLTEQPQAGKKPIKDSVTFLSPHLIRPFRRHPFRLYEGERFDDFVASVSAHGILTPVIVRKIEQDENGYEYEMLAGHNRQNAAILIGLEYIPCIVKENLSVRKRGFM